MQYEGVFSMKKITFVLSALISILLMVFFKPAVVSANAGDTAATAMTIQPNTTYTDNLTKNSDEDWFKITLPVQGRVQISMTHVASASNRTYRVYLYTSYGENSDQFNFYTTSGIVTEKTDSDFYRLPAGDYYVRVISNYFKNDDYTINVGYKQENSDSFETEWNNNANTASILPVNRVMTGNLSASSDEDWYKVTLPVDGRIEILLTHVASPDNRTYRIYLYTNYGENSNQHNFYSTSGRTVTETKSDSYRLSAGDYYIRMISNYFKSDDYTIKVEYTPDTVVPEFARNFAIRLYQTCLGREPDASGLAFWANGLANKTISGGKAADFFLASPEIIGQNLSNEAYIKVVYRALMGREYDQDGLNFWLNTLSRGESRMEVVRHFLYSPEFEGICQSYGIVRGDIY